MIRRVFLFCLLSLELCLCGCQGIFGGNRDVKVDIEGGGEFPQFLVGTWQDKGQSGWQITFNRDGTISSAIINLGFTEMRPGRVTKFATKGGGKGVFKPGKWEVYYAPDVNNLTVRIVLKSFYENLGKNAIEGNNCDILSGPVSEVSGEWSADWYSVGRWVALIPEPREIHDYRSPEYEGTLVLEKVDKQH
jgi:hypothetical protein